MPEKKRRGVHPRRSKIVAEKILLHALLGKTRALGRTLTGLELRIAFADDVKRATAFDHLTIGMTTLGGIE